MTAVDPGAPGYRVHIVGCAPRAGTTLLKELLLGGFETTSLSEHEVSVLVRPRRMRGVCVSKHPHEISTARRLLALDHSLWVIYCLRDPRAVVCSRHPNDPGLYWVGFDTWLRYDSVARRIDHPRFTTVRYEDIVRDPDSVQQFLAAHMPFLTVTHPFSEPLSGRATSNASRRAMHNADRIHEKSVAGWQQNLPRIREQLQRFPALQHEVVARGYETSPDWVEILRDVPLESLREKPRGDGRKFRFSRRKARRAWLGVKYLGKMYLDRLRQSKGSVH